MSGVDYGKFRMSLQRLREQYENYCHLDASFPRAIREGMAESVIHRFEICYDCLWKALKRHMIEVLGVADAPNSPKPIFRLAFENDLLGGSLKGWLDYADRRVGTAHDYSFDKAEACLDIVEDFIADSSGLYKAMTEEPWD